MGLRSSLQSLLEDILESENVYFQPPSNLQMAYPAIVYKRDDIDATFADNAPYCLTQRYLVTVIDRNPDSEIPIKVALLPMCLFNRMFVSGNLNHNVFILHF